MTAPTKQTNPSSRREASLDDALLRMRMHGLPYRWAHDDLRLWEGACPSCRSGDWDLLVREPRRGGPITLRCRSGCSEAVIRATLEREPVEARVEAALDLAEQTRDIAGRAVELAAKRSREVATGLAGNREGSSTR